MQKFAAAACLVAACLSGSARAQDLSLDAKRMLAYGTTAVMVGSCEKPITAQKKQQMMASLTKYAERQKDITQEQFTEAMKAAGTQIGSNRDVVCAQVMEMDIDTLIADAEQGK